MTIRTFPEHVEVLYHGGEELLLSYDDYAIMFLPLSLNIQEGMVWATELDTWVTIKEYLLNELQTKKELRAYALADALDSGILDWHAKC
jgi:hypothetical protein